MINHRANEIVIIDGLEAYLGTVDRPCKAVRQNQIAQQPPYPYVSYTVTTPLSEMRGTYSKAEDGTLYQSQRQTWSFTVQSDDMDEALELGMKLYDFFTAAGLLLLHDENIAVIRVTNLTARDNLISIQYEYRVGLDVTFNLLNIIAPFNQVIESVKLNEITIPNNPVISPNFVLGASKLGEARLGYGNEEV